METQSTETKKSPGRFNPNIVYPVGTLSFRRSPENPTTAWEVLSHRPDSKTKVLPTETLVLETVASGKLARARCEELQPEQK